MMTSILMKVENFNPRSPCGERLGLCTQTRPGRNFNPRSPCGERLRIQSLGPIRNEISIHAPRVGSDQGVLGEDQTVRRTDFNPRSPCGERRLACGDGPRPDDFNPRSPCGERRGPPLITTGLRIFQSTLPVWGATGKSGPLRHRGKDFNPRSPCGERRREYSGYLRF